MAHEINGALNVKSHVRSEGEGGVAFKAKAGDIVIQEAASGLVHTNFANVTQATSKATAVTANGTCGVITLDDANLAANTEVEFVFNNTSLKTTSIVLVSCVDNNTEANAHYTVTINTLANGSCNINLFNAGGDESVGVATSAIHFLIINAS